MGVWPVLRQHLAAANIYRFLEIHRLVHLSKQVFRVHYFYYTVLIFPHSNSFYHPILLHCIC